MKLTKTITIAILIILLINIQTKCFAKYVFDYILKAIEVEITENL